MSYQDFVKRKLSTVTPTGISGSVDLVGSLFPHQSALTQWALRRGRAAIFADTGLGKMRMELAWADAVHKHTNKPVMIHTPLAVAQQIATEGRRIGLAVNVCRDGADVQAGINVINYDRLHKIDPSMFGGVVLDESGCIKHAETRAFKALTDAYRDTPFKLPATATPAPNDWTELGTHAEFLGICTKAEMLAEFFMHDGGETSVWRLKGHARQLFWRWVSSWGAMIRKPSDLGFDDGAYNLPALHLHEHQVSFEMPLNGMLFATDAQTLSERREARRKSMEDRVAECVALIFGEWGSNGMETRVRGISQSESGVGSGVQGETQRPISAGQPGATAGGDRIPLEAWVIWCDLNVEQDALEKAFGDLAFSIRGSDTTDEKELLLAAWLDGERPVIISKPSILGWGINMQRSARMAFVGVTDSYEAYYQAVRRCWRFGQSREVHVHIFACKAEGAIVSNLKRKEREAGEMADSLSAETREAVLSEVIGQRRDTNEHNAGQRVAVPSFLKAA